MLVLLPPSEGKTAPDHGGPVALDTLTAPDLNAQRTRVLAALVRASRRDDAASVLGTGPSLAAEVRRNTGLEEQPAAEARHVYTGVLYGAADLADLPADALDRATRTVRTVSALWGLVAPTDRIPAYRLSMGTDLPGVGPLARAWRPHLAKALDPQARDRLVVDCRSVTYAAAWRPPAAGAGTVAVRVLRDVDGRRTVVSHWAKHARGLLTRHLVSRPGAEPASPEELLAAAGEMVGGDLLDVELSPASRGRSTLSLVVG